MTLKQKDETPNESKLYVLHTNNGEMVVFDPENQRYKCCCNQMHVRTACILIGLIESLVAIVALVVVTVNYFKLGHNYSTYFAIGVVFTVLYIVLLSLFFCSLCTQNATFLVGHILLQLVSIVLFLAIIAIITVQLINDDTVGLRYWAGHGPELSTDIAMSYLTVSIAIIVVCSVAFVIYIWFIVVVFRCYRYFVDRKKFRSYIAANQFGNMPLKTIPCT